MPKEAGKKSFLDFFKMKDLDDEFEDDLFDDEEDDDEDDDYIAPSKPKTKPSFGKGSSQKTGSTTYANTSYNQNQSSYKGTTQGQTYNNNYQNYSNYTASKAQPKSVQNNKLVEFNNRQRSEGGSVRSEVYVIKPLDINDSQVVVDSLLSGRTIVLNMEGLELAAAQRIIDFVCGACYALNGSLKAISGNIFIAVPQSIELSGDLRDELLSDASSISLQFDRY